MIPTKPINFLAPMIAFAVALILLSRFLEFPSLSSPLPTIIPSSPPLNPSPKQPFSDLTSAFAKWDAAVGCSRFKDRYKGWAPNASSIQDSGGGGDCVAPDHVSVLVKGWTWIPDNLDNLYSCRCGLSCLWTKSPVLADKPDVVVFENVVPPTTVRFDLVR